MQKLRSHQWTARGSSRSAPDLDTGLPFPIETSQRTLGFANSWDLWRFSAQTQARPTRVQREEDVAPPRLYGMPSLRGDRCDREGWNRKKTTHRVVCTNWGPNRRLLPADTSGQRVTVVQISIWFMPPD